MQLFAKFTYIQQISKSCAKMRSLFSLNLNDGFSILLTKAKTN